MLLKDSVAPIKEFSIGIFERMCPYRGCKSDAFIRKVHFCTENILSITDRTQSVSLPLKMYYFVIFNSDHLSVTGVIHTFLIQSSRAGSLIGMSDFKVKCKERILAINSFPLYYEISNYSVVSTVPKMVFVLRGYQVK